MGGKMTLTAALERYKKITDGQGCTDGGCLVQRPTGMHTNGGCRCSRDTHKAQRVMCAAQIMADAIAAHLTQPAQAVDVGAIREVAKDIHRCAGNNNAAFHHSWAGKLTRAIGNVQAEGWKVPTGCVLVAIERGEGYEDVHPELVAEDCLHCATERGWRYSIIHVPPRPKE